MRTFRGALSRSSYNSRKHQQILFIDTLPESSEKMRPLRKVLSRNNSSNHTHLHPRRVQLDVLRGMEISLVVGVSLVQGEVDFLPDHSCREKS